MMKNYISLVALFIVTFCNAQENHRELQDRKVEIVAKSVKNLKLTYHIVFHLSLPKRIEKYSSVGRKNKRPFSFERDFANRIQGNFRATPSAQKPGPKPSQWSPLIVTDGIEY
jgi:hypothetical protein